MQNVANEEYNKRLWFKVNDENSNLFHTVLRHANDKFYMYKNH